MTDTKDIAALRVEIDTPGLGSVAQLRKLAHYLLDQLEAAEKKNALVAGGIEAALKMQEQLEAERQRADAVPDHVITIVNQQTEILELTERVENAGAEIAALREKYENS